MNFEFTTFVIVTVLAVISPGADFAMVTRNALVTSRRSGVLTATGISVGVLVHVTYAMLGIGFLISQSILAFNILKIVGAAYLLWLGINMILTKKVSSTETVEAKTISDLASLKMGFLTNVLNPKTTLFVISVYAQLIQPEADLSEKIGYGLFMSATHLVWFVCVAMFFSTSSVRSRLLAIRHWIDRFFGIALSALGLSLAFSTATSKN